MVARTVDPQSFGERGAAAATRNFQPEGGGGEGEGEGEGEGSSC